METPAFTPGPLRRWPWLLAFALLALGAWGARPLWEPDEGRYGESAREMAISGDWLVPRLRGEVHLTKPPLTYWLAAAGLRLSGVGPDQPAGNAWGARLFTALASFGAILCVVALGRSWGWSEREAHLAGLIFATAALPFGAGHILTTDMLLTFWEILGVLCAWRVWNGHGRIGLWRPCFWAAFGLAFLTKGPPGLLPMLALAVFCKLRRSPPRARLWSPGGLTLMLLLAFGWYLSLEYFMPGVLKRLLSDEVLHRVASNESNRAKPFWFYFAVVPLGMAPWLHLWPPLVAGIWRRLHPGGEGSSGSLLRRLGKRIAGLEPPALFALLWFSLVMIVFQVSVSKMPLYVVPIMPPIALWMARMHFRLFPSGWPSGRAARMGMMALSMIWIAGLCAFSTFPDSSSRADSYVALAQAVRRLPIRTETLHVYGGSPDSIGFYSGIPLENRTESIGPYLRKLADEAGRGRTFLLIAESKLSELSNRKMPWREAARQREWLLVELLPPAR